jgi:hypothetical protein
MSAIDLGTLEMRRLHQRLEREFPPPISSAMNAAKA